MAMTYTSLIAAKGTSGAIATWVNYTKLDIPVLLDEAQTLLYSLLRVREMRTRYVFQMKQGNVLTALPARFLDAIGRMYAPTMNLQFRHKDESTVNEARIYNTLTGTLANNALTTSNGSSNVSVAMTGHGLNQGSLFTIDGAATFNGLSLNGTFDVVSITDANTFVINCAIAGTASASGAGGGASMTYTANNLVQGSPVLWAIWDEQIQFDAAFNQTMAVTLQYYQSLPLLSASNQSNFLTSRYPQLLRTACQTAAADFMKDDTEYQKCMQRLTALVQQTNAENDMAWRSMELETETP